MGRHRPARAKVPPAWTPGASGLRAPVSVWGGARRGRIPAPPQHSVHFLSWLQISTASFAGHLRPLPAAWPRADPRGDRWSLSCPLRVWSQLCPQPSALPRGPGREQGVSRRGGGTGLHVQPRARLSGAHVAPTACPGRAGAGHPEMGGAGHVRRARLPPLAPNTQTISPRREGGLEGRGPPGRTQEGAPGLRSPGRGPVHVTRPPRTSLSGSRQRLVEAPPEARRVDSCFSAKGLGPAAEARASQPPLRLGAASRAALCPLGAPRQAPREAGARTALPGPPAMGLQPAAPEGLSMHRVRGSP